MSCLRSRCSRCPPWSRLRLASFGLGLCLVRQFVACDAASSSVEPSASSASNTEGWKYHRVLNVASLDTELTDYQVAVDLSSQDIDLSKAKSDGGDLRFVLDGSNVQLPYWIEQWNSGSATAWVRVPSIPIWGTTILMYYGNPSATSASSGAATFDFFDDYSSTDNITAGYFQLSNPTTVLTQSLSWETSAPHTLSVVQVSSGGQYWGYYGLQGCNGYIGLAKSDDLNTWTKLDNYLSFSEKGDRWPSVLLLDGKFHMVHTKAYCSASYIVYRTSTDGLNFSAPTSLVAQEIGANEYYANQNPDLFKDPVSGNFYLYWFRGHVPNGQTVDRWEIRVKSAATVEALASATSTLLLSATVVYAAPQVMYYDGTYYMALETLTGNVWSTRIFTSNTPDGGFTEIASSPILNQGSACFFQHIFGTTLHAYSCERNNSTGTWTVGHRTADLRAGRMSQLGPDTTRWQSMGSEFSIVQGTQPSGATGPVLQGSTAQNDLLLSSYVGTNYVVEAYGNQKQGRVWGLAIQATDSMNFVTVNIYEDLDGVSNMYVYSWLNGTATELARAAIGTVNPNTWYKLTLKVSGNRLTALVNDAQVLQTSTLIAAPGKIAVYGERDTVVQIDNLRVRRDAPSEPTLSIGPELSLF